nr:protein pygopus-like [Quercus suber]
MTDLSIVPQMRPNFPHNGSFGGPQMGGQMLNHSSSGNYMNGSVPQQPSYSPMPPHAQPHMGHMQSGGPGGFGGSPRPPMMQHQGSHQGYQPPMHMGGPQFGGPPGQHPYHLQQGRQLSSGHNGQFPQMTPRQQPALPQQPSPGMGGMVAQGDEGK